MVIPQLGQRPITTERRGSPALTLRAVVKRFGNLAAVDGIDLEVPTGICLGLLGPNGAGKSTTMRMLTGQARQTSGAIDVMGFRVPAESKQARALMGVVPQMDNLDEEITARQNLEVFARLYRVPAAERGGAVERALRIAELTDRADVKVAELSGGMRRRLLIARGLVHTPGLLLLDEPTVGLDPQVRQDIWALIDALRGQGATILMSTHYIEEAERLADDAAMMSHGRVIARGAPRDLIAEHAGREVVEVYGPSGKLTEVEETVHAQGFATRRNGPTVSVLGAEDLSASWERELGTTSRRAATLEDVFVLLTGESVE